MITTDRLLLTPFAPEHREGLFEMNSNPEVMRYLSDPQTQEQVDEMIAKVQARWGKYGFAWWTVLLRDTDTVIGAACLQHLAHIEENPLEIGWRLIPDYHGKGYATEAGQAAMDFGFNTVGVDYVCAVADPENTASTKVMERLGMTYAGIQTHYDVPCATYEKHRKDPV